MKTQRVPKGSVKIMWRLAKDWRNGDPAEARWRRYGIYNLRDAEMFMKTKAPHSTIFEYKIEQ